MIIIMEGGVLLTESRPSLEKTALAYPYRGYLNSISSCEVSYFIVVQYKANSSHLLVMCVHVACGYTACTVLEADI